MGIVMDMSSYEIDRSAAMEEPYGAEVLCAGWNPALALMHAEAEKTTGLPPDLAAADAEAFLRTMYAWQR